MLAKPPVRKLARDLGVDLAGAGRQRSGGLDHPRGRAGGGRRRAGPARAPRTAAAFGPDREQRIPVKGVRKLTAENMVASAFTAPHVTEFLTVDMTRSMQALDRLRELPDWRGVRVSPLLLVAKAVLLAVGAAPDDQLDAGRARPARSWSRSTSTWASRRPPPRGLIVPNIKDAGRLSLRELADAMTALVATAKDGQDPPADMAGGTFTITNVGVFGVDTGTPILPPGEAAILAFGAVRRDAVGPQGQDPVAPGDHARPVVRPPHRRRRARVAVPARRRRVPYRPGGSAARRRLTLSDARLISRPRPIRRAGRLLSDLNAGEREPNLDFIGWCRSSPDNRWRIGLGSLSNVGMSTLMQRMRNRREATRRTRAIEEALRQAPSQAMRRELLEMAMPVRARTEPSTSLPQECRRPGWPPPARSHCFRAARSSSGRVTAPTVRQARLGVTVAGQCRVRCARPARQGGTMSEAPYPPAEMPADGDRTSQVPPPVLPGTPPRRRFPRRLRQTRPPMGRPGPIRR